MVASSVLLRDEQETRMDQGMDGQMGGAGGQGPPQGSMGMGMGGMGGDMTIGQALMQARNQIISNLSQT